MDAEERERLILDNMNLVHFVLKSLNITQVRSDYDDYVSIGTIGLIKAVDKFDVSQGTIATYACKVIRNEVLMTFRNDSRHTIPTISLEQLSTGKDNDSNLKLEDKLKDKTIDFDLDLQKAELLEAYNILEFSNKDIFEDWTNGMNQMQLAIKYNMSQSNIARKLKQAKEELRHKMKDYL